MTLRHYPGPLAVLGASPNLTDGNPDAGPSVVKHGMGFFDSRFWSGFGGTPYTGIKQSSLIGWGPGFADVPVLDQVPSTAATANIAALANVGSGTPMTLVNATGAGVTVGVSITNAAGVVVSGLLALDGAGGGPWAAGTVSYGPFGSVQFYDPTKQLARAVSITGVAGGAGGSFLVQGFDLYGFPQTETIVAAAGAATTNGKKAWKYVQSVTPQFTDAHNYSVGTADIFGFPLLASLFAYARIVWNNAVITANTGFTAPDATTPATATTGDPRGTYAVQSSSDGTKRLQVFVTPTVASLGLALGVAGSLTGVTPA